MHRWKRADLEAYERQAFQLPIFFSQKEEGMTICCAIALTPQAFFYILRRETKVPTIHSDEKGTR